MLFAGPELHALPEVNASMSRRGAAVPRYRRYAGPAVLSQGFRPFFLLACGWSVVAVLMWALQLRGFFVLPTALPGSLWHAHTMLAGFLGAALTGYALTAVPNWSGRFPVQGTPLAGLAGLWVLGRAVNLLGGGLPVGWVAAADLALPLVLLFAVGRELARGRGWRGAPVAVGVGGLAVAIAVTHLAPDGARLGQRIGVAAFAGLIAVVGGRLIPSFTGTALRKRGVRPPAARDHLDRAAEVLATVAALAWAYHPGHPAGSAAAGLACGANAWRLARWRGWSVGGDPGLWGFHLGYAWLVAGLAAIAAAPPLSAATAVHALTAGAMGCLPLAVMTRLGLAHAAGRLRPGRPIGVALILVALAAAVRMLAPLDPAFAYTVAAGLWIAGFTLATLYLGAFLLVRRSRAAPA